MHNIYTDQRPYNVDKKSVQAYYDEMAYHDHYLESSNGLPSDIKWNDLQLKDLNSAKEWIDNHDYSYAQLAVSYYDKNTLKYTPEYNKLYKRVSEQMIKVKELTSEIKASKVKAKFLSCPHCESKLSTKELVRLKTNECPLCHTSLLSQTQKDKIKREKKKLCELKELLRQAEIESKKRDKRGKGLQWLIKVEWHS